MIKNWIDKNGPLTKDEFIEFLELGSEYLKVKDERGVWDFYMRGKTFADFITEYFDFCYQLLERFYNMKIYRYFDKGVALLEIRQSLLPTRDFKHYDYKYMKNCGARISELIVAAYSELMNDLFD